jgi:hypothetical protein
MSGVWRVNACERHPLPRESGRGEEGPDDRS